MNRNLLMKDQSRHIQDTKCKWSFITSFSVQYKQIKDIFNHHWKVLKNDRALGPVLPDRAGVIYRGLVPLGSKLLQMSLTVIFS